ncbi:DUF397 domain-containing protein [Micromonospora sp. NPDC049679]|uniref:DUF397 domain-containing protein n=1 Tax=Micromonospora sp. NPDC049679 TaxID=3155920 RepID=UPI0033EC3FDC
MPPMPDISQAIWIKSSRSSGNGQCVEVAGLAEGVGVRDSKDADGPVLVFNERMWTAFVTSLGDGGFSASQ